MISNKSPCEGETITLTCKALPLSGRSFIFYFYPDDNSEEKHATKVSTTAESITLNAITRRHSGHWNCKFVIKEVDFKKTSDEFHMTSKFFFN